MCRSEEVANHRPIPLLLKQTSFFPRYDETFCRLNLEYVAQAGQIARPLFVLAVHGGALVDYPDQPD